MKCEICSESFEEINPFNQHMTYVHHTDHLEMYSDYRKIATEFHKDIAKFEESDYCQACGIRCEYTVCVIRGDICKYAGSCEAHHGIVLEFLKQ